jgi:hypothetical protein
MEEEKRHVITCTECKTRIVVWTPELGHTMCPPCSKAFDDKYLLKPGEDEGKEMTAQELMDSFDRGEA